MENLAYDYFFFFLIPTVAISILFVESRDSLVSLLSVNMSFAILCEFYFILFILLSLSFSLIFSLLRDFSLCKQTFSYIVFLGHKFSFSTLPVAVLVYEISTPDMCLVI